MPSESAFIRDTGRVDINNAYMTMHVNHPHAHLDEEKHLMTVLMTQSALTAQFDSKERYKPEPARCAPKTRENILKRLREWVESPAPPPRVPSPNPNSSARPTTPIPNGLASSLFWLHGGAGAGKSALAHSLAESLKEDKNLAASFFFFSIDASRNNGEKLFPTIIYQLTKANNSYEKKVIEQLRRHSDIFQKPPEQQMKVLFTEPLMSLHAEGEDPSNFPRLIIIDGLDECKDDNTQCEILSIIAQTILSGPLPYPFRFLVASRPEGHILRAFDSNELIKQIPVIKYDLSKDIDAAKDIRTFLQDKFKTLCDTHAIGSTLKASGWPSEHDLVTLVDRSSGHFVYPATVLRYIESSKHRPDDRLSVVLGLSANVRMDQRQPFFRLDELYTLILTDVEKDFIHIKRAFSILYLISEKVGYFSIYRSGSSRIIQDMLVLRPGDLDLLFDPLRSLVAQESEEENLHVFHKTLFDFLLSTDRSASFGLTKHLCHESAALYMHNTDILTTWSYAPDFMYFAYHCYLAQPIEDAQLISFLTNLEILYIANAPRATNNAHPYNNTSSQLSYQNEKALLTMFTEEGEQAPGVKTIFYILRMLSLLSGFPGAQDLHQRHCTKIARFYGRQVRGLGGRGQANQVNGNGTSPSRSGSTGEDQPDRHAVLDETIRNKLTTWQPSEEIFTAIMAAKDGSTSSEARHNLIKREHTVFESFARSQHRSNCGYHLQSTLLPSASDSDSSEDNQLIAHSYHIFSVEYEGDPSLMVLVGTYSREGKDGVGAVEAIPIDDRGERRGAGAVFSAQEFDITLLNEKEFEDQVGKFLDDHIAKVTKELGEIIDDQFENKFEF